MRLYLAGAENKDLESIELAGWPYRLCSYWQLRDSEKLTMLGDLDREGVHWIMDSGLFSFMFGSAGSKQAPQSFEEYHRYAKAYLDSLKRWGWKHTIVETDIQKVLGSKKNQQLRDELFHDCGMEVIYVWHLPDGEDGLREMARRYRYIALSVPELRRESQGARRLFLLRLLRIIREEGDPKIHLLGTSDSLDMRLPVWSCDSTTWIVGRKFGHGVIYDIDRQVVKQISRFSSRWRAYVESLHKIFPTSFTEECDETMVASALSFRLLMDSVNQ